MEEQNATSRFQAFRKKLDNLLRLSDHPIGLVLYTGVAIFVSVALLFHFPEYGPEVLRHTEVTGHYIEIVGIVYAVLLGFVVFVVWSEFNDAQRNVELEGNALWGFLRIIGGFSEETRRGLLRCLLEYAHAVKREWQLMKDGEEIRNRSESLETLWSPLSKMNVITMREQALYAEALQRFAVINETRSFRRLHSKPRMPGSLWMLLLSMGAITVGSMYFFGLEHIWSYRLMIGVLAGSITFILFLIFDLDRRFSGIWVVKSYEIDQVIQRAELLLDSRTPEQRTGVSENLRTNP